MMRGDDRGLRGRYAIVGVGQSAIGDVPGTSAVGLLATAMRAALDDAGLTHRDVDGLVTRGPGDIHVHHQHMGRVLGINVGFSTSLDNGGASQAMGVMLACWAIESRLADV